RHGRRGGVRRPDGVDALLTSHDGGANTRSGKVRRLGGHAKGPRSRDALSGAFWCVRSAGDLAGLEATGAHVHALRGAVHGRPDALDVGIEATLRNLARPGAVVAEA